MTISLPPLPYDRAALEPWLSADTVERHHDALRQRHADALAAATTDGPFADATLEDLIRTARGLLFEQASLAWTGAFHWGSLKPAGAGGGGEPAGKLAQAIARDFGDVATFRQRFGERAGSLPADGSLWLVQRHGGALGLVETMHAVTPLTGSDRPLLVFRPWAATPGNEELETPAHRIAAFWQLVDWKAVGARLRQ